MRRKITIEATPARLRDARDWAWRVAAEAGLDEAGCFEFKLAASEIVGNAIEHGAGGDGDGRVVIEAFDEQGELVFEVRGGGRFSARQQRATLDDERGRGLELVRVMMDELTVSDGARGSSLRFSRRLD